MPPKPSKTINVAIPRDLADRMREIAFDNRRSLTKQLEASLEEWIKDNAAPTPTK